MDLRTVGEDGAHVMVFERPGDAVTHENEVSTERQRLAAGSLGELCPGDPPGKAEVVLDEAAETGLATHSIAFDDSAIPDLITDELVPDTTPPDTVFDHTVKRRTHKRKARFTFHASEAATFSCVVDKRPVAPCSSPFKVKVKKRGKHTLRVYATDAVGLVDATPATWTWKVKKKKRHRHPR